MRKKLIITTANRKEYFIKNLCQELIPFKVMTLNEFLKEYYFDYNNQTIAYLIDNYNLNIEVAKIYLDNMLYIKDLDIPKVQTILTIKKDLEQNNLLIKNPLFKNSLKDFYITLDNLNNKDPFIENLYHELATLTSTEISNVSYDKQPRKVYEYQTLEDEVVGLANNIIDLIKTGIDPNNIKIVGTNGDYIETIKKIFNFYHIPFESLDKINLLSKQNVKSFITLLNETKSLDETIEKSSDIDTELLKIINQVVILNTKETTKKDILLSLLENTTIKQIEFKSSVKFITFDDIIEEKDHVFIISINQNIIPSFYKDEDYFNDKLKSQLGLMSTSLKNKCELTKVLSFIYNTKNITLSYKLKSPFSEFFPSNILEDNSFIITKVQQELFNYSHLYNKLLLTRKLDKLLKWKEKDINLSYLYNNYKDIPYLTYNSSFTGLNKDDLDTLFAKGLSLSYTALNSFFLCPFKYYLKYSLRLEPFEETFSTYIGNLYHFILSIAFENNFDFEKEFNKYIEGNTLTNKELIFLKRMKNELLKTINIIKEQNKLTGLTNTYYEKKLIIDLDKSNNVTFNGTLDKILYIEKNGFTYYAVIDYKSGFFDTSLKYIDYGLNLQLPSYLYLLNESNLLTNPIFTGVYYQKILSKSTDTSDYLLQGYSTDVKENLEILDSTYENSALIKSLKLKKDGNFGAYAKVYSDNELNSVIKRTKDNIMNAKDKILSGEFPKTPRLIEKTDTCNFCKFTDICFKTTDDYEYINTKEEDELDA